ncbi:pyridoxal-phosphate dependent enzyme, partial [Candidatus Poribacteria bacterium]|nr:pyridoxal-phosphate dependent enzyme [Candidatus Poribacteria bacterium]
MDYTAWFECDLGCTYPLTDIIYRCPNCDGLLQVQHDMDALKQRSADDWKSLFEERYMRTQYPYGSGVWGKKEVVCPMIDDENIISMYEGGTNLFWAERFGKQLGVSDLWIKQCGNSHTGSFKDLGMTVLVSMVKQIIAESGNIRAVMCASTGDTSASLAAYASAAGIPAIILLPKEKVTREQLIQPIANGALT